MAEPIGNLLDSLGVEVSLEEGDLAACAIVLLKVIDVDGSVRLQTCTSDGLSWIERLGMLRAAEHVELPVYEADE